MLLLISAFSTTTHPNWFAKKLGSLFSYNCWVSSELMPNLCIVKIQKKTLIQKIPSSHGVLLADDEMQGYNSTIPIISNFSIICNKNPNPRSAGLVRCKCQQSPLHWPNNFQIIMRHHKKYTPGPTFFMVSVCSAVFCGKIKMKRMMKIGDIRMDTKRNGSIANIAHSIFLLGDAGNCPHFLYLVFQRKNHHHKSKFWINFIWIDSFRI